MIKIVKAETIGQTQLRLTLSDGTQGDYDLAPLLDKDTVLTRPLKHPEYFNAHFIELGALCWRNGLELSPAALTVNCKTVTKSRVYNERLSGVFDFHQQAQFDHSKAYKSTYYETLPHVIHRI